MSATRPPTSLRLAEDTLDLGLGAGIARRCQPSALQLAIVAAFQALAELLRAVASLRPPNQRPQARRAWRPLAAALGTAFRRFHVTWQHVFHPVDELGRIRQRPATCRTDA